MTPCRQVDPSVKDNGTSVISDILHSLGRDLSLGTEAPDGPLCTTPDDILVAGGICPPQMRHGLLLLLQALQLHCLKVLAF